VMVQVNAPTCAIATAPLSSPAATTTQIEALEVRPRCCRVWAVPLLNLGAGRRWMGREWEERTRLAAGGW
jgi:hypothetical protein